MKMVRRRRAAVAGGFCCHEHGMDRGGGLDEVARRFNRVNAPRSGDP
jgi:hypothetical protein